MRPYRDNRYICGSGAIHVFRYTEGLTSDTAATQATYARTHVHTFFLRSMVRVAFNMTSYML